jgi:hypothetical protein
MSNKALSNKTFWIGWVVVVVVMQVYVCSLDDNLVDENSGKH